MALDNKTYFTCSDPIYSLEPNGLSKPCNSNEYISDFRVVLVVVPFFIIIGLFIENNFRTVETPDKMPRSVTSDLDLHSLHLSHKQATNLMSLLLNIDLQRLGL